LVTLIILKSDELTDRIIGPNLFINAVLMPALANVYMFGCSRQLIAKIQGTAHTTVAKDGTKGKDLKNGKNK